MLGAVGWIHRLAALLINLCLRSAWGLGAGSVHRGPAVLPGSDRAQHLLRLRDDAHCGPVSAVPQTIPPSLSACQPIPCLHPPGPHPHQWRRPGPGAGVMQHRQGRLLPGGPQD